MGIIGNTRTVPPNRSDIKHIAASQRSTPDLSKLCEDRTLGRCVGRPAGIIPEEEVDVNESIHPGWSPQGN
jgi:hypothetical protein